METADTYISIISTKKRSVLHYLNFIFTYFLSVVLLFAGLSKIINPSPLIDNLSAVFGFLPETVIISIVSLLPIAEVGLGLLLIFSLYYGKIKDKRKTILLITTLMFGLFWAFSIYGYILGMKNDCGCFGNSIKTNFDWLMIIRNTVFTVLSFRVLLTSKSTSIIQEVNC